MASRFHQREARNALFSSYDAQTRARPSSSSPSNVASSLPPRSSSRNAAFSAYPSSTAGSPYAVNSSSDPVALGKRSIDAGFRPATPNNKGQYSDAVLNELESQNDEQTSEMSKKVKMLKDLTIAIGTEIRDSTALADSMNDNFEATRKRLRGTMNRMLRMAERTGVGWKVWLIFFVCVFLLFAYVRLF